MTSKPPPESVIWTDPVTGQQLLRCAEYDRPVWWLDIMKHSAQDQARMFSRYKAWKAAQG